MKTNLFLIILLLASISCSAGENNIPQGFGVDFNSSMAINRDYSTRSLNDYSWNQAKQSYDKYIINRSAYSIDPRIPKVIHHIWLGSPFPEKLQQLRQTWIDKHPDWQFKLWTDKDVEELGLVNKHLYDISKNYGQKSDIARYEILYRFGGLYVDTDFECIQSFDMFHHCCDFYTGIAYFRIMGGFNGLMASVPGHPILGDCIDRLHVLTTVRFSNPQEILGSTGPEFFTVSLRKWIGHQDAGAVVALPMTYFYPWPWWERANNQRDQIVRWIRPETCAIHHWHVSWNDGKTP